LTDAGQRDVVRELGWYTGIAAIYFASLYAGPRDFDRLLIAVYASVLVSGILSALYLYGGMTWLIDQRVTLYENLRLSGVQYNPNVLSKLAGVAVLSAALTFSRRPLVNACLLPVFSAVLYAAGSKAAILGVLVLMSFWIVWELRLSIKRALRVAGLLAAVLACMTVTHVAADRFAPSTADVQRLQMAHGTAPGFWSDEAKSLLRFFRIGTGYRMEVVDAADGSRHVDFQKVTGLAETGQRLDLWAAGLRIMKDNWLWGLGPEGLTEAMMREVDYPHTSPHNVILEMVDGYGLAGLALYALTLFFLFRAARRQWADGVSEPTILVVTTTVAFFLIVELVEPSVAFAYGVVGLWFWHYAALLVAVGPNADQKRTAQTSRVGFSL
jgi:O-antigen ligase